MKFYLSPELEVWLVYLYETSVTLLFWLITKIYIFVINFCLYNFSGLAISRLMPVFVQVNKQTQSLTPPQPQPKKAIQVCSTYVE